MAYITDFEQLKKQLDAKKVNPDELVSKQSSEKTKALFAYLKNIYGKKILAGQQYLQPTELEDVVYYNVTGKLPAVRGYDMMDIDNRKKEVSQTERAIEWAKKSGCIITMCWHWYAPDDINNPENCDWAFYCKKTTSYDHTTSFDVIKAVEAGTPEYEFVVSRIDKVAANLKRFEQEDIPVLWRPLHEANGSWFWWGNRDNGATIEAYKKLWYMIFDRLENYHKLTNLIWVWNGQGKNMSVNPNTFDICGEDIYPETVDHSSQKAKFDEVTSYTSGKMAALSECGYLPEPTELVKDNVKWLWWLPWWGEFVFDRTLPFNEINAQNVKINEKRMSEELLHKIFTDDYCVTLEKLPWVTKENIEYAEKILKDKVK